MGLVPLDQKAHGAPRAISVTGAASLLRLRMRWFAVPGNPVHQSYVLLLRTPCCHHAVSTEYFGTVLDYLCDGWERAQLVRRLYNAHVGLLNLPDQQKPAWPEREAMKKSLDRMRNR